MIYISTQNTKDSSLISETWVYNGILTWVILEMNYKLLSMLREKYLQMFDKCCDKLHGGFKYAKQLKEFKFQ